MGRTDWLTPGTRYLQLVWHDRSVRAALFVFTLTRALIFTIFILATHLTLLEPVKSLGGDNAQITRISLYRANVAKKLRPIALRGDGGWYLHIAQNGYERKPFEAQTNHNWVFFPLFPLLWRYAARLTGGFELTGIALSNLFFLAALVLLHKTASAFGCDEATADRTIFYTATFPLSYFFSVPMTESLFLLLSVCSFYAAKRDSWWVAGIIGGCASATRVSGIFLLPALLVLYWQSHRSGKLQLNIFSLLLIPAGLIAFMFYLYLLTGNALAFLYGQAAWGRAPTFFLLPLWTYILDPTLIGLSWDFRLLNFTAATLGLACGLILAWRREWALAIYTFLCVISPLSSLQSSLQSVARYVMVVFPVYIVLARWGRSPRIDQTIRVIFIALLGLMSALFALIFTIALA